MSDAAVTEEEADEEGTAPRYEFDAEFQTKIAALVVRDSSFNRRTEGLVKPEFFENEAEASLVNAVQRYFATYKKAPDSSVLVKLVKDDIANKIIRSDLAGDVKTKIKELYTTDISDRDFVVDEVAEFARTQAVSQAILDSVNDVHRRDFAQVDQRLQRALRVGAADAVEGYDYFAENENREQIREADKAGTGKRKAIPTGIAKLDKVLHHGGWGIGEMTSIMGAAKSGKSIALGNFALNAAFQGFNVLFVTLEVSTEINADRMDAALSGVEMNKLQDNITEVKEEVDKVKGKVGKLLIHEYPSGQMTPAHLRRVIERYKADGVPINMVVLDYADICAPTHRTDDPIENSRQIYLELRATAQEEELALLTATQTNREGAKQQTAKMDHVAEDFNRVRIVDLMISINATDDEKDRNEARLHFAASRNQAGDVSLRIKQDLDRMRFISRVLGIE